MIYRHGFHLRSWSASDRMKIGAHMANADARPRYPASTKWWFVIVLAICAAVWVFAALGISYGADLTANGLIPGAHFLACGPVR